jgi:heat shock protein HspQ
VNKTAKFNIGDLVIHTRQGYRGVIIDIDPVFQASGRYNPQACKRDFSIRNPWYRLLVDNSTQITYVEEPLLQKDPDSRLIENPNVDKYLVQLTEGYCSNAKRH